MYSRTHGAFDGIGSAMVSALMITLHHLNNSRSQRILWLLEELELPYEITLYQRDLETRLAPDSLKKVHPLGKSPVSPNPSSRHRSSPNPAPSSSI